MCIRDRYSIVSSEMNDKRNLSKEQRASLARMKAFVEEHKSAIVEGRARPVQDYGPYRHEVGQNDYANPRNSSRRIGIYCLTEKSGRQRIGGFNVDDTGVANLEVMNEQFRPRSVSSAVRDGVLNEQMPCQLRRISVAKHGFGPY